jgi:hypothetical protein
MRARRSLTQARNLRGVFRFFFELSKNGLPSTAPLVLGEAAAEGKRRADGASTAGLPQDE